MIGEAVKKLRGKTLEQAYSMLPIGEYTKLMVDEIGIYNPKEYKEKYGGRYIHNVCHWSSNVLYVEIYCGSH